MEKTRKNLKELSIVALIFVGLSLIRMIVDVCLNGFGEIKDLPEGVSESVGQVALVVVWVLGILFLIPQIYVGVKGIKQANNPTPGKAHIVWAFILAAMSVLSTISAMSKLSHGYSTENLLTLIDVLLNVIIFVAYFYYARKVAAEIQ